MLTTKVKSFGTFVIIAITSSPIATSLKGFGLMAISISTAIACGCSSSNKVIKEIIMQMLNLHKKRYEKDQTINFFDRLYSEKLQDNLNDKTEFESLGKKFTKFIDATKTEPFFLKVHTKLNFKNQPRT